MMNEERELEIGEAIKRLYATEPLAADLGNAVLTRLRRDRKPGRVTSENALLGFVVFFAAAASIFCIMIMDAPTMPLLLLISGVVLAVAWSSYREFSVLSRSSGNYAQPTFDHD